MATSFHTYDDFEDDIQKVFTPLMHSLGLKLQFWHSILTYTHPMVELRFGIERQQPELSLLLQGHNLISVQELMQAADDAPIQVEVADYRDTSARVTAQMLGWRPFLARILPQLIRGDLSNLKLPDKAEQDYEYRLAQYVRRHAPIGHPARSGVYGTGWRARAEAFLAESDSTLDGVTGA